MARGNFGLTHARPPQPDSDAAWLDDRAAEVIALRVELRPIVDAAVKATRAAQDAGAKLTEAERRKARELCDELIAELLPAGSPKPAAELVRRQATLSIQLAKVCNRGSIRDVAKRSGAPRLTVPELAHHLARIPGVEDRLDDTAWLLARVGALADWANERVRTAISRGRVVTRACRRARCRAPDHVHYCLLRLTQKRDRASHYGIRLDDPELTDALFRHALMIARNVRAYANTVKLIWHGDDDDAMTTLAEYLGSRLGLDPNRPLPPDVAAANDAFKKVVEAVLAGPEPGKATEREAREARSLDDAEYVFASDWVSWCRSVRKTMEDNLREELGVPDDGQQTPGAADPASEDGDGEPETAAGAGDDDHIEAGDDALADLERHHHEYQELRCSHAMDAKLCNGTCLLRHLDGLKEGLADHECELAKSLSHRPQEAGMLAAQLVPLEARLARNAWFAQLEQARLSDLLAYVRRAGALKVAQVARLSLWTADVRPCARNRLATAAPDLYSRRMLVLDDFGIRVLSRVATQGSVRSARYNFLAALERHDWELAYLFQWLRSDPEDDEFKWMRRNRKRKA